MKKQSTTKDIGEKSRSYLPEYVNTFIPTLNTSVRQSFRQITYIQICLVAIAARKICPLLPHPPKNTQNRSVAPPLPYSRRGATSPSRHCAPRIPRARSPQPRQWSSRSDKASGESGSARGSSQGLLLPGLR